MRAMTVVPGRTGTAAVETLDEPADAQGELLVSGRLVGVCGTDREIAEGVYGEPPQGESRLVLGHEGLGEVLEAPVGSGFQRGDLVVGIVRRPDPVPGYIEHPASSDDARKPVARSACCRRRADVRCSGTRCRRRSTGTGPGSGCRYKCRHRRTRRPRR